MKKNICKKNKKQKQEIKETSVNYYAKTKTIDDFVNQVIEGDCIKIMKEMPSESVDLIITSPPYYNAIDYKSHIENPQKNYRNRPEADYNEYLKFLEECFTECWQCQKFYEN